MPEWVRYPLPWWWSTHPERLPDEGDNTGIDAAELRRRWGDLGEWVSWFVDRYHLATQVPGCWPEHPALVDELTALRYYHEEVTCPLVPLTQPDPVGTPQEPDDPGTRAHDYWLWHEARWRWASGPLRDASGYRDCVTKGHHVTEDAHGTDDANAFGEALQKAADSGVSGP